VAALQLMDVWVVSTLTCERAFNLRTARIGAGGMAQVAERSLARMRPQVQTPVQPKNLEECIHVGVGLLSL
jgi:hypothetical protein